MYRLKIFFSLFAFWCCSSPILLAQTPVLIQDESFREDAVAAIDSLYNRNFEASVIMMESWKNRYPEHPIWNMWSAMELWWHVLDDLYDTSLDNKLMEAMQRSDYRAGKMLNREPNHPDALIIRALSNGYVARHHANRENWLTSVRVARKAYLVYQQLMEIEPDFEDNEFVRGMVKYYAEYIPEEYPIIKSVSWFLPDGDKEEGLRKIDFASKNGVFARPEATYFMGNILLNYEHDYDEALGYFQKLVEKYPDNGYYRRLHIRALAGQRQNKEVVYQVQNTLKYWETQDKEPGDVLLEELHFWEGQAHYRLNRSEDALDSFRKAIISGYNLPNRSERLYYTASTFYAGMTSEALQKQDVAQKYYSETIKQSSVGNFKSRARDRLKNL